MKQSLQIVVAEQLDNLIELLSQLEDKLDDGDIKQLTRLSNELTTISSVINSHRLQLHKSKTGLKLV